MLIPSWTVADFARAMQALMPRGLAWPREQDAVQTQVIDALAPTAQRVADAATNEIPDAFPATTVSLIPEWQQSLGLPDPCLAIPTTNAEAQAQIVAKLIDNGGQSISYFIGQAAALGYTIAIEEYVPFRPGRSRVGIALVCAPGWQFAWTVTVTAMPPNGSVAQLECLFSRKKPAHTVVIFAS